MFAKFDLSSSETWGCNSGAECSLRISESCEKPGVQFPAPPKFLFFIVAPITLVVILFFAVIFVSANTLGQVADSGGHSVRGQR